MVLFFIVDPPYMKRLKMKIDYWGLAFLAIGLGCLQIVLDKGQREDWFSSSFITWLSLTSLVSLILFVIVEFFTEHPIVNLRIFKKLTFSTGNVVMFFAFFNLFGSIVLLPIYLQTLMGYTSTLAGLVLGPGGIATLIAMPIAGRLVTKINPKAILAFGIIVAAYSTYLMSQFNLLADFNTIIWPRVVLGVGMGFLFIPLTTLTMSAIRKEDMGNASAIYNLLRNLGGSFGVAFVTTMLARRAQLHQVNLVEHLTPFDTSYQLTLSRAEQFLQHMGLDVSTAQQGSLSVIHGQLLRQASMLSFNDVFYLISITMICVLPLVLLMKRVKLIKSAGMH
jgi:DHA2 family multidrug resistance protein